MQNSIEAMTGQKNSFVLGLGHQKCGTTWLYNYLCQSPKFAEGYRKEFHVWDRLDIPLFKHMRLKRSIKSVFKLEKNIAYKMENSPSFYFDYFSELMKSDKSITADITPSYSGLKADRLRFIKDKFFAKGIEEKVVK